jgi:conjugative coupling factor TraD (TOL family)
MASSGKTSSTLLEAQVSNTNALDWRLRPAVELQSAGVAAGIATVAALAPWALMMQPAQGVATAAIAGGFAFWRGKQGKEILRYRQGLKFPRLTYMAPHKIPVGPDELYLGHGFEYTQRHTQRMVDASHPSAEPFVTPKAWEIKARKYASTMSVWARRVAANRPARLTLKTFTLRKLALAALVVTGSTLWFNPLQPYMEAEGSTLLHGVGLDEAPISLKQSARPGHMLVLGTTRVGKTRLLEILAAQDILAGHVVIVIDPKGDAELMKRMYAEAERAGRLDQFYVFHLGYPEISARYNGIGNFSRITEVATRATNPLPSAGNSAAFKEFSWRFSNIVAQAQVALGRVPTYDSLLRDITAIDPLFIDYAKLLLTREKAAGRVGNWEAKLAEIEAVLGKKDKNTPVPRTLQDRATSLTAMWMLVKELRLPDPVLGGLSTAVSYEKSFFEKIIASLGPFLEKLTTGAIAKLISPDYFDENDQRPIFDWMQVIRQGGIVYVGLDALSDATVGSAVGNSMLADLVSVGGKLYKEGLDPHNPKGDIVLPKVCCHFDEINEIAGPEFVPMVNKMGGSGFCITAYSQAIQDIEAKVGDKAKAEQILANFNHVVMLRVRSQATAEFFTQQLPEVNVTTLTMVSGVTDTAAEGTGKDFVSNNQDRVGTDRVPLITPADIMRLPKGQAFVLKEGNRLFKIRIPLADTTNDPFIPESLRAVAEDMQKRYRTSQQWWTETDWLSTSPIGLQGTVPIVMDVPSEPDEGSDHGELGQASIGGAAAQAAAQTQQGAA